MNLTLGTLNSNLANRFKVLNNGIKLKSFNRLLIKIILNTKGMIKDLNDELIEFLNYIDHSHDETAEKSKGDLVKNIHAKVIRVKNHSNVEVEFMTLLERDREKIEEGREEGREEGIKLAKRVLKLFSNGETIENIAKLCEISVDTVKEIIE